MAWLGSDPLCTHCLPCMPPLPPPTPDRADFHPLVDSITYSDYYLLANDFADYIATQVGRGPEGRTVGQAQWGRRNEGAQRGCTEPLDPSTRKPPTPSSHCLLHIAFPLPSQDRVDAVYKDQAKWTKMSIMSTAGSGFFSSDRTIAEVRVLACSGGTMQQEAAQRLWHVGDSAQGRVLQLVWPSSILHAQLAEMRLVPSPTHQSTPYPTSFPTHPLPPTCSTTATSGRASPAPCRSPTSRVPQPPTTVAAPPRRSCRAAGPAAAWAT